MGEQGQVASDVGAAPAGDDPLVGRSIEDRYDVVRLLGAGAMGAVYEVRHKRLGKRFAMKVIHAELAQVPEFVARFEQEARACSFLEHANCIAVTDFGRAKSGELYLVMEYVEGQALGDLIEEKPLRVREALEITAEILSGLVHAHEAGIIHRDMKLDNVMRVDSGGGRVAIKILDFGIAKVPVNAADGKLTQAGIIFGTPEYMAPEQAVTTQVDARADLYAVGVMLFQLLRAHPPFRAEGHVELLNIKLTTPAPTLDDVAPGRFAPELSAFVARALEREPSKRFATAREMLAELEPLLTRVRAGQLRPTLPQAPASAGVVGRALMATRRLARRIGDEATAFWHCADFPAELPSWKVRAKALVTTRRGALLGGGTLALLVLLVGLPLALSGSTPTASLVTLPSRPGGKVSAVARRPVKPAGIDAATAKRLVAIRLFLARKACREAVVDLKNLLVTQPKLAGAHYLLGAASICRRHYAEGLAAYEQAIELDARYLTDARIHEDLKTLLSHRRTREKALRFAIDKLGVAAEPLLVDLASHHKNRAVRHAARDAAIKRGLGSKIDKLSSLSLDLKQLSSCSQRKEVLPQLLALDDKRALPALKRALYAKGGFLNLSRINGCMARELRAAIKKLEGK